MRRFAMILLTMLALSPAAMAAGLMQPKGGSLPPLQIEDHQVKVVINNGFAITEIDQTFHNPHDVDLDAVYTFPLPRAASLSELSLWIDGHEVVGEVVEKEEARKIVRQEKEAGRESALAEKREYLAFDVFVSPVRAGSSTRVRLVYLQPIEIDGGVGRYVYPLEEGKIDEEMHTFWDRLPRVHGKFSFECTVRSSYPLEEVRAKGFPESVVTSDSSGDWTIWVDGEEGNTALDRDIVIYYRLAPELPARVDLLPYRAGDGPGSYMLIVTPGVDLREIAEGVDWTVVLDVSGSMADKITTAGSAVSQALDQMRPQDRFRVITFSKRSQQITQGWVPVSPAAVDRVREQLMTISSNGGTNLHAGLKAGLQGLEEDRTSAVLLVSDGGANVGPTGHRAFLELLDRKDVRIFTFVMGQGANRPLLQRLADESGGFSMDVSNQDDLYGRILQARSKLGREALHGLRLELDGARVGDLAPERLPSLYFGQQLVAFGRYFKPGEATLRLRARISGEDKSWETRIVLPEHDESYPEIERLWALARIRELQRRIEDGGDKSELRQAVVGLGTEYSIVSDYTSMVVVRDERFEELGIDRKNKRRVDGERAARATRSRQVVQPTRADAAQPMFGDSPAHHVSRGGGGAGAAGPAFVGLLAGLYGARVWLRRRRDRS
jgi:Ca-activated chloride channel family protein